MLTERGKQYMRDHYPPADRYGVDGAEAEIDTAPTPVNARMSGGGSLTAEVAKSSEQPRTLRRVPTAQPAAADAAAMLCVEHLENGFWTARQSLDAVYTTALARMSSPWAVLAYTTARALAQVRPCITLPPLIGVCGSLNWFAAVVAISGGGKGAASAAARSLVPDDVMIRNLGSGEGIVQAYVINGDTYESIMFNVDEIDTITALGARNASTLMSVVRSGFTGETLGFSYADKTKRAHLDAHTYRMTIVMAVQPERAGGLLDAAAGGTPQRIMWFPATDRRITADTPWPPDPLTLPTPGEWQYPREIVLPAEAEQLIKAEHVKRHQGDGAALDGHALFCREKFAYALAVLDGRVEMTDEDWQLSGVAAAVSTHIRDQVVDLLQQGRRRDAAEAGALHGISQEAADNERQLARDARTHRVLRRLLANLDNADGVMTNKQLTNSIAYRDRPALQAALTIARQTEQIRLLADGVTWEKL
jgi:hypothetical protein